MIRQLFDGFARNLQSPDDSKNRLIILGELLEIHPGNELLTFL